MSDPPTFVSAELSSSGERRCVEAFVHLTRIEKGLRALIAHALSEAEGPKWWRTLPPDIRDSASRPDLAYTNFPDLKKILGRNWTKISSQTRDLAKQQVMVHLEELEGIRNDIAHSRSVSIRDLALVQGTYYLLEPVLSPYLRVDTNDEAENQQVDLLDLQRRIHRRESLGPDLVRAIRSPTALPPAVADVILEYGRLIERPGRRLQMIDDAVRRADSAITSLLADAT